MATQRIPPKSRVLNAASPRDGSQRAYGRDRWVALSLSQPPLDGFMFTGPQDCSATFASVGAGYRPAAAIEHRATMATSNALLELSWWWLPGPTWTPPSSYPADRPTLWDGVGLDFPTGCGGQWPGNLQDGWNDLSPGYDSRPHILEGQPNSWPQQPLGIGVGCIILSALLIALGLNLMRYSTSSERRRLPHRQRLYFLQPRWVLGALLLGIGHGGTFVASAFASDWIVSLLGLSALLWNLFLGKAMNGEPIGGVHLFALLCVLCGLSAYTVFGFPHAVALWSPAAVNARWRHQIFAQPFWLALFCVTVTCLLLLLGCDCRLCCSQAAYVRRRVSRERWRTAKANHPTKSNRELEEELSAKGSAAGAGSTKGPLPPSGDTAVQQLGKCEVKLLRLLYPVSAGLLAGWTAILTMCLGEIVKTYLRYPAVAAYNSFWSHPEEVLYLLIGACAPLPLQVHILSRSLVLFEAQVVLPAFYVPFAATAIGGSAVFFGSYSWDCFTWRFAPLCGGLALAIFGVLLLVFCRRALPRGSSSVEPTLNDDELAAGATTPPDAAVMLATDAKPLRAYAPAMSEDAFDRADLNKDGKLNKDEFSDYMTSIAMELPQPTPPASQPLMPPSRQAVAPWLATNGRAPRPTQLPPLPLPRPPPAVPSPELSAVPAGSTEDSATRERLEAELGAQRAQIAQLQLAILDIYQQQQAPPAPQPTGQPYGYDHVRNQLLPPPSVGAAATAVVDTSTGTDPSRWGIPEGTQAGQVFNVDGRYYVAVAAPPVNGQQLPPIPPAYPPGM